jgi:hypothetical protein
MLANLPNLVGAIGQSINVTAPDLSASDLPLGSGTGNMTSTQILDLAIAQQQAGVIAPCPWYQSATSGGPCKFPSTTAVVAGAAALVALIVIGGQR